MTKALKTTEAPAETTKLFPFTGSLPEGVERMLDLGQGLEVWKVPAAVLREQDINAQTQPRAMFDRLTTTIKKGGRLESLPLCAAVEHMIKRTPKGEPEPVIIPEIVSGHHRVRAGMAAGLSEFFCLVDTSGLSRDEIRAKQLAHNAIHGTSDPDLLKRIYEQIRDAEARLEAFVPSNLVTKIPTVTVPDIAVSVQFQRVLVMFLPIERDVFERAAQACAGHDAVYVADQERFEDFRKLALRVSADLDIRSMGTILATMGEIVLRELGEEPDTRTMLPLRDVLRASFLAAADGEALGAALDRLRKGTKLSRLEALAAWAHGA
jgi:hypothetical protein